MIFNRATAASDRSLRQGNNNDDEDDDDLDSDEDSDEDDSSDDNIDRGCDSGTLFDFYRRSMLIGSWVELDVGLTILSWQLIPFCFF
jgi:hypothetical protein